MNCLCCSSDNIRRQPRGFDDFDRCGQCGLIFQSRKTPHELQNSVVEYYQTDDPHIEVAHSKKLFFEHALRHLNAKTRKENKSILDVGCGYGYFLAMARKVGWQVFGVEITDAAVMGARKKLGESQVFHGTTSEASLPENSIDAITLWDVLDMVGNPLEEIETCYRLLKEGGILGIRVRNLLPQKFFYYAYLPFRDLGRKFGVKYPSVFHPYCFSPASLKMLLSRVGFEHIQIVNSPLTVGDPYGHVVVSGMVTLAKRIIGLISKLVFILSGKKWIIGPSLLIWAEKPRQNTPH